MRLYSEILVHQMCWRNVCFGECLFGECFFGAYILNVLFIRFTQKYYPIRCNGREVLTVILTV